MVNTKNGKVSRNLNLKFLKILSIFLYLSYDISNYFNKNVLITFIISSLASKR